MTTQQRQHRRFAVSVGADLIFDGATHAATTQNLSEGGVSVVTLLELREGAALEVHLFLTEDGIEDPDATPFEANAKVAWSGAREGGDFTAGLKFDALSQAESVQLLQFLSRIENAT